MTAHSVRTWRLMGAVVAVTSWALAGGTAHAAGKWTIVPTPNPGTSNTIGAVVTFGTEVWAVGTASSSSYTGCHGRTLTARYNGTAFVEVPSGNTPMCGSVDDVSGTSTADLWAVGSTNNGRDTFIRHWNGADWSIVAGATIPVPSSGGRAQRTTGLAAVAAITATDVWAVGRAQYSDFSRRALIEHWNGSTWSLVSAPGGSGSRLEAVVALAANDVWAAGRGPGSSGTATLIEHWNGSTWSIVPSPSPRAQNALYGIAAVSPTSIWAVGDTTTNSSDPLRGTATLIEHWNGTSWSVVPSPNAGTGNNTLAAVSARSDSDVWAVGSSIDVTGEIPILRTLTMHWDGAQWTVVASPNAGTGDNTLTDTAITSGGGPVWASGGSAAGTLVERFSG